MVPVVQDMHRTRANEPGTVGEAAVGNAFTPVLSYQKGVTG